MTCLSENILLIPVTSRSISKLAIKNIDTSYCKLMSEQSQMILKVSYEKSLNLEGIPNLLPANKVKAKDMKKTKNIRVTAYMGQWKHKTLLNKWS